MHCWDNSVDNIFHLNIICFFSLIVTFCKCVRFITCHIFHMFNYRCYNIFYTWVFCLVLLVKTLLYCNLFHKMVPDIWFSYVTVQMPNYSVCSIRDNRWPSVARCLWSYSRVQSPSRECFWYARCCVTIHLNAFSSLIGKITKLSSLHLFPFWQCYLQTHK